MILETGLVQEEADRYVLTGPLSPLAIPSTLHDSLMARLDRLGTDAPVNRKVVELIRKAEAGAPPWPAADLRREVSGG